ncbi:MAG: sigma-70 family RNA polymerase sigma factor [Lachnospiraceae bacterium]|nr:sigma-70 family RNA polymerase sigma factor [Lachnospiraceae bacterium]
MKVSYEHMADEKLIDLARAGEKEVTDFLIEKYKGLVKSKARVLFLLDGDNDDLVQEGMIGVFKAIRDYDAAKEASFKTFVNMCIDRQMYDAIRKSNRKNNSPLNSYIPFSYNGDTTEETEKIDIDKTYVGSSNNPEDILIEREQKNRLFKKINESLSSFEKEVLRLYVEGMNYHEIAESMAKTPKSIDNALQRIKAKVKDVNRTDV